MKSLTQAGRSAFQSVRFVLTDRDETLTFRGRLAAATYDALERLQRAGLIVIPVTATPAGWCDQMARMWPVDGVIGENGGFLFAEIATQPAWIAAGPGGAGFVEAAEAVLAARGLTA